MIPFALRQFRSATVTNTGTNVTTDNTALFAYNIVNRHSAAIFVKFYNSTVATFQDTPVLTVQVGANLTVISDMTDNPLANCPAGLTVRVVTDNTDAGNTAAATLPILELRYK